MQQNLRIIDFSPEHQQVWYDLNHAWISKDYVFEAIDHETLSKPDRHFLKEGAILLAELDGEIVGTVAIHPTGGGAFAMSKMTVSSKARGFKIGEKLGLAILDRARSLGAKSVFLFSNTKAFEALNLYFKLGFRVVPLGESEFERANIRMEIKF